MKLGTQTASVINHLQSRGVIGQPEPVAGMGATVLSWSDRHAATVFRVLKVGKSVIVEVREDHSKVVKGSGHDGSAEYEYKVNVSGYPQHFARAENGMWYSVRKSETSGRWVRTKSSSLRLGSRESYRDPSF